jgi:phytoene synthase
MYAAIGHDVARRGMDSVSQRARVPRKRKAVLLALAVINRNPARAPAAVPCLAANRFLVDAVVAATAPLSTRPCAAWWRLGKRREERVVWVIGLFERLERGERCESLARISGSRA